MLIVNNLSHFYVICYFLNCVNTVLRLSDMIDEDRQLHKSHHV